MWWLDPGKEVLNVVFNRILAPYVENLDMNQVNYGIGQGQLTLKTLRLKKGALDKFRLPVDVVEGHLGKFTLSLHWMNLGNQPVEVLIEDVYLLVVPSSEGVFDPEEEEQRKQAAKAERLENAELLHLQDQSVTAQGDQQQSQGLISSLITKIVNNLQVTVKNIHIRYEDRLSVPGHPFAAGITLSGFTAVSVNDEWRPAFIDSTAGTIHKLANLVSLAIYFDTDAPSLTGLSHTDFVEKFTDLITTPSHQSHHQFILQPVTGEGRIKMNHKLDKDTPRFDVQLLFDQIGVLLDDNQYRDAISLVDMYHFYMRQHQYQKYRPLPDAIEENRARAMLQFAMTAIQDEVRERRRKWTWEYFAERRDDRQKYVELFKKKQLNQLTSDLPTLEALERKLSYEDIRFYRSIARSQLRKDIAAQRKLEEEKQRKQTETRGSWTSWLWGSSTSSEPAPEENAFTGEMTDEQRRQLYEVLDYDEKAALTEAFQAPQDALKVRVVASLDRGSFALKTDPHGKNTEIISVVFDALQSTFIQRPDNFEVSLSVGGFAVRDGTTTNTLHPLIVHVQEAQTHSPTYSTQDEQAFVGPVDAFFYLKFENNPLDDRADSALTVRMKYMEIIYHRGYVEAIYKFFKPPSSQLESVEALLNVASQTLEGLRKETRAGLEYALQTHKTVDVQMDLNAPIIIVPEDITTNDCRHLIIDAGHIAIESQLANKKAIQEINAKRKQQYTDEDYKRLESMMYDKLSVRLEAAQFLIGNDLKSCREALTSNKNDNLHLLERINIDLQVQNSIVPTAYNIARFKVFGHLPSLYVNLSDTKYKSLMRLIDVAIPNFDGDLNDVPTRPPITSQTPGPFRLPVGIFGAAEQEYNVEDGDDDNHNLGITRDHNERPLISDGGSNGAIPDLHQHIFELDFRVDTLRASLSKSVGDGSEQELGNITLDHFALDFAMEKFVMKVDVNLKSVLLEVSQLGKPPLEFMSSSAATSAEKLLTVKYTRVQAKSPEFLTVYEGVNQSVDVRITTFLFRAAPEPLVSLYGFIMTTFVPERSEDAVAQPPSPDVPQTEGAMVQATSEEKIRVLVKLASVQVILINDDIRLATISMSTGDVAIFLRANTMLVNARLGSLNITDDSQIQTAVAEFKQILSIEGDNFADFMYQTYDPEDKETYKGVRSAVHLKTASLKLHYLEQPLQDIYQFLLKLAELKGLYDAATVAAVQRASEIERMQFDISVKSPIVIFPSNPQHSSDVLILRLGELTAKNAYEDLVNKTGASLRGIQFASWTNGTEKASVLKIIDNIDVDAQVVQTSGIDRSTNLEQPDMQITIKVSDVITQLTQVQYCQLMALSQSVARVFSTGAGNTHEPVQQPSNPPPIAGNMSAAVDLQPELRNFPAVDGSATWSNIDLYVAIAAVRLHLYDDLATSQIALQDHGIVSFALKSNSLRTKVLSNGALEAQLILKSFTMNNTAPGNSKFREIIPAAQHDRNQVMILYTSSGGSQAAASAIVTVDAPQVIFAVEPVISLLEFFTSPFPSSPSPPPESEPHTQVQSEMTDPTSSSLNFRLDLHDVSVSVLEDEANSESQAIKLSIKKVFVSQQGVLALSVDHLGMSLTRMGHPSESVRFLDDVDLTLSMDTRSTSSQQMTSIEVVSRPVVLRASYRDINLIMTIVNKAIELYGKTIQPTTQERRVEAPTTVSRASKSHPRRRGSLRPPTQTIGSAKVLTTKEQLKASVEGFRLVLIGDQHEQPMLHLKVKPFILGAKDWSGELQATTTLAVHISYWNLTNSHWEPLIDPWTFTTSVARDGTSGGLTLKVSAQERLNLNLSTTFIELALVTMKVLGQGENVLRSSRGSNAAYRIHNRTGCPIHVWSDIDGSVDSKDVPPVQIPNDSSIDWRFDDWKTIREHVSSAGHNSIGLQFIGKQWEQLRSIPVDREGEYTFSLRPRSEKYAHRVLCEVTVQDNVKIVTIRSTYKVENQTLYPLEVMLVNEAGQPTHSLEKIVPGQDYALPIDAVSRSRIRIQPDQGFGYKWSPAIRWEDLLAKRSFTIRCPHADPSESAFRFQAWVETDAAELNAAKFPKIILKLRAPIELENLLPYNIEYRIYDKDTDQNWRSYLRKGGIMPIHSVELRHLVLLNINVQDTAFKASDFSIINTDGSADFDIESRLTLRDSKDRKLDLRLNYIRYPNSGGCFKVQIYTPYVVINKTGLPFAVKPSRSARLGVAGDVAGESRQDILSQPIPFMLAHPADQGKNFIFKVGQSMWSQPVSFEAPGADTRLVIPAQTQRAEEIQVGLSWAEGLGKYKLTKVITLSPRFLVRNATPEPIQFREYGVVPKGRALLNPGEREPLHVTRVGDDKLLTIATPGLNAQWSAPINLEDIGTSYFRLKRQDSTTDTCLMRADVKLGGSTIFVVISQADEGWPFIIENESDQDFVFCQADLDHPDNSQTKTPLPRYSLRRKQSEYYAWDFPAAKEKRIVLRTDHSRRAIDIMEIGDLIPFKFSSRQGSRIVSLDVRAEGSKQILRITNYNPEFSLYKPLQRSGSLSRQDSISSSHEAFEAVQEEIPATLSFIIDFAGVGVSLINRRMVEVVYLSANGLKFEYTDSPVAQAINLVCGNLQIDNQLHDALYPVVLQPTPIPKGAAEVASLPTVQGSVIWLKDQEHGVLFLKYCSILLQALTVEADEDFLFSLYDLTKVKGASWDEVQEDILTPEPDKVVEPESTIGGTNLYFEVLELQPIKLTISFMRTERVSGEEKLSIRNPFAVVVNAITMAVGNVNDAPLEMNALAIKDMRLTLPDLQDRILIHYRQEVLRQLYRILGSADFIGNPVGLFTNVSSGVADIFYEPFNGAVMHGNKELGIGIAKGAASFVKKTVFGFSDSFTRITSSVGKGLSAATFDSEYQMRRRMAQRRNRPRHAIYGVTAGAEAFASSVASGIEGVLMKPIEGAETEGAKGFFKGVGKGLVGAVTKPVIGVFDLASNLSEGIRNTTTVFDNPARDRVRMPRHVPPDAVLVPFSERESLGQYWMKDLDNGAYRNELYVAHYNVPGGDNVVLLTTSKVLSFWSNKLRLEWELPFTSVQGVTIEDTGIRFAHKSGREYDRFVIMPDKSAQTWFFGQIATVVKAFNARRRMD